MSYERDSISVIKSDVQMQSALIRYGIEFNRRGFARCPFHNEKTASFKVHNNRGHCFGCGWHGDIIDFVSKYFGLSEGDAIEKIANDFYLPISFKKKPKFSDAKKLERKYRELTKERSKAAEADEEESIHYRCLWDWFCLLDKWEMKYKPTPEDPEIDPRYAEAVKFKDYFLYRIYTEIGGEDDKAQ